MNGAITEQETDQFNALLAMAASGVGSPEEGGLALVRATFFEEEVAAVAWVVFDDDGSAQVHPLALLTNEWMMDRIIPPEGAE